VWTYSALLRTSIDVGRQLQLSCSTLRSSAANLTSACSTSAAVSDLSVVLAAISAVWNGESLPTSSAATQAAFTLSLGGSALVVLRSLRPAFTDATTASVGGTPCSQVLASQDGSWLVVRLPSLHDLQCGGVADCGYAALIVKTPSGSSAVPVSTTFNRRLSSSASFAYRGATLACPPFCPGLPLPSVATNTSVGAGVYVPVALDDSDSAATFAALPQAAVLAAPVSTAVAASTGSSGSSTLALGPGQTSGFGIY